MKITILCSSQDHPVFPWLEKWVGNNSHHQISLVHKAAELTGGEILFLISANEMIKPDRLVKYQKSLVIHASDLPKGRGWSPHVWQVLEGKNEITISLLEAAEKVDSGPIWAQRILKLRGDELTNEINQGLFAIEMELMDFAVKNFGTIKPMPQAETGTTTYRKRTPEDSRLDPDKTIAEQFNLLRVVDNQRFPAFFDLCGYRYEIMIEKKGRAS